MGHDINAWVLRVFVLALLLSPVSTPADGQSAAGRVTGGRLTGQVARPEFVMGQNGEFIFHTGTVQGILRKDGKSRGLSSVIHNPAGARLDGGSGLLGYYRVFTTNHRYGPAAWNWPSTARLLPDGAVEITFPAQEGRPFKMGSIYRWRDAQTLDLETTVSAEKDLSNFEVFLSSYCHETLTTPAVYVQPEAKKSPTFLVAEKTAGDWQMFLGQPEALTLVRDGRWRQPPNPVDWIIPAPLAQPICLRRGPDLKSTVILMAPRQDCYAISMPYRGESHYSLYLSLFGHDIKAGQTAMARSRFIVTGAVSDQDVLALFEAYENGG